MLKKYKVNGGFDEMLDAKSGVRSHYRKFTGFSATSRRPSSTPSARRWTLAFLRQGITFNVYGDAQGAEKIFPFDLLPRIIPGEGMGDIWSAAWSSASPR